MAEGEKEPIWIKPVLVGVAATILWVPLTGSSIIGAIGAGIAATGIAHLVLSRMGGKKSSDRATPKAERSTAAAPDVSTDVATDTDRDGAPAASVANPAPADTAPTDTGTEPLVKASKSLPGESELAARKGTWTYKPASA